MTNLRRIAVDWDGTLVEEKWPEMGEWLPGAVEALKTLAKEFDEVVIHTCRVAGFEPDEKTPRDNLDQISAINDMLYKAGIPFNVYVWTRPFKPPAEHYIDNRAHRYDGYWGETLWDLGIEPNGNLRTFEPEAITNSDPGDEDPGWGLLLESGQDIGGDDPWIYTEEKIRTFDTGATRDTDDGKLDYEGFLSPLVLRRYAEYMHTHRIQSDGSLRSSDNWQKGIPFDAYMKSGFRHFMDWWVLHREWEPGENVSLEEAVCALIFNASGYLHELLLD